MTAKDAAEALGIPYRDTLGLIAAGVIKASQSKARCRWEINARTLKSLVKRNQGKIDALKAEVVAQYWQGHSPEYLQAQVDEDIRKRGIILSGREERGFAERAIYETLPKFRGGGTQRD